MKYARLLFIAGSVACGTRGPRTAPMITDRPDFTESAETVPPGLVQAEGGVTRTTVGDDRETSVGEALVRIGVTRRSELRLELNSYSISRIAGVRSRRFEDPGIGAKVALIESSDGRSRWIPRLSIIGATSLPTNADGEGRFFVPEAKLVAGWDVSDRLGVGVNLNAARPVETGVRFTEYASSLSLGIELAEPWGAYAEYYNSMPRGARAAHYANGGVTFGVTPTFQLDARIGIGGRPRETSRFLGIGVARRW